MNPFQKFLLAASCGVLIGYFLFSAGQSYERKKVVAFLESKLAQAESSLKFAVTSIKNKLHLG